MGQAINIDPDSTLFDTEGMFYKEFSSDYRQIRYYTLIVLQKAPSEIKELNLLEQQLSEIIKNAVKHGNKKDPEKKVRIWYKFSSQDARIIIEDEGEGFQNIEEWNEFNKKRLE
ncbi:MAG: ATP-binding protein, partial [Spirochaetia bacterium]